MGLFFRVLRTHFAVRLVARIRPRGEEHIGVAGYAGNLFMKPPSPLKVMYSLCVARVAAT